MNLFTNIIIKIFKKIHQMLTLMREIFFNTILFLIFIIGVWFIFYLKRDHSRSFLHSPNGVLVIPLNNFTECALSKQSTHLNYYNHFLHYYHNNNSSDSIFEIIKKIKQAETDPNISAIILRTDNDCTNNQTILEYLGKKLNEFKKSKKPIIAIGKNYSQSEYYLASFANKIVSLPNGSVQFNGITNSKMYLKNFLNALKVHIHIFKIGKYKSAIEPFLRNSPSLENKKIDQNFIQYKWKKFLQIIARNRHVPIQEIDPYINHFIGSIEKKGYHHTTYALNHHLIDNIVSKKKIQEYINNIFKKKIGTDNYHYINIQDYPIYKVKKEKNLCGISIILANGVIGQDNADDKNTMNMPYILQEINRAKNNDKIKAVILRINSPGGSVEESEIIRSKLYELHKCKKPVVISMGDMSASGGYWIATAGDYIIAHSTTVTGSIGIFSVIPTLEKLFSSIGIKNYKLSTFNHDDLNIFNDLSIYNKKKINLNIYQGYKKFIKFVAKSRNKTPRQIHKIAQGRVWLGIHAKKIGLVDKIGDIDTAIKKAAQLAHLNNYRIFWPKQHNILLKTTKNIVKTLIKDKLQNFLKIFFPMSFVQSTFQLYKNLFYIWNIIKQNKLIAICLDNYTLK